MITIKAVVMAGGKGTRLRPLTCDLPKPMVPILNKPIMEYSIELLRKYGIKDIAVTMAYLPSVITDYFTTGDHWGVNLKYYIEKSPLGTGGSVKNADDFLDDTFIVISGDALTDIDISKAIKFHKEKNSKATLLLKKESVPLEYGVIITDEDDKIVRFLEKPSWGEVFSDTINTGIYILEPEVLDYFNKGENFDFSKDLFPKLLEDKIPMYGYVIENYWSDVGDLNSYKDTQFDILKGKVNLSFSESQIEKGIWIGEGSTIGNAVNLEPPVYIGKNCHIDNDTTLGPFTIIGDNSEIKYKNSIERSIIWKNTRISNNSQIKGSVICSNVALKERVNLYEDSVIGSGSELANEVVIKPNIKIWPHKKIDENTVANQNMVWGTKVSKTLFGFRDISGEINIDITPEFASKLGSSFASTLKGDDTYVVSSDDTNASRSIKNSLVSGILSTGGGIIDITEGSVAMNRFAVRHYKASGGIHVRMDDSELNKVHIEIIDSHGANIDRNTERKIENIFNREDFERCNRDRIKDIIRVNNFSSLYIRYGLDLMKDIDKIKIKNPKLIISSRSSNILNYAKKFLEDLGCEIQIDNSINKYTSVKDYLTSISSEVVDIKADMGIIFSENGENLILIDNKGTIIDKEKYMALISLIALREDNKSKLVVPYNSPRIIEKIANEHNTNVIRTKSNPSDVMRKMITNNKNTQLLQYVLYFDGIWGSGKIIDFLVKRDINLSVLIDEIPDFHFVKQEIECHWKDKGRVIREVIEEHKDEDIELFEGVKINSDKGWALILPDSEKPLFNVYTEGFSEEYAKELSTVFSDKVKSLLNKK
ncbi:MAG: nucleotidyl transferase [Firmicutes bacterium]|nr:nucleotidyl transferase [Bacillota bacterium]